MGAPMRGRSEVKQCKRSDSRYTWEKRRVIKLSTYLLCPKFRSFAKSARKTLFSTVAASRLIFRLVNLRDLFQICDEFFHFVLSRGFIGRAQYRRRMHGSHHVRSKSGFYELAAMLRDAKITA